MGQPRILKLNYYSSDKLYRIAILDLATQEERLWHVQSQLESWHSMVPQCVIMSYTSNRYSFRNNGRRTSSQEGETKSQADHSRASPSCLLRHSSTPLASSDDPSFNVRKDQPSLFSTTLFRPSNGADQLLFDLYE